MCSIPDEIHTEPTLATCAKFVSILNFIFIFDIKL